MGKRWTEAEDDSLRVMRAAKVSYRDIARMLKRTEQACAQRGSIIGATKKGSDSLPIDLPAYTEEATEVTKDFSYLWDVKPTWWRRALRKFIGG